MSNKPFLRVPVEVIKRYGYTRKLLGWMLIHGTRNFKTNEPTITVRNVVDVVGVRRWVANQLLADYRDKNRTKTGQSTGQSLPPPEPVSGEQPDSGEDKNRTKTGQLRLADGVSPISNSGIKLQEKEKETTTTTPDGPYKDLLTAEEMFNIFWQDSTGKGSKKKAKDIWLRLCNLPVKVLEKEHEVSTHLSLYRKIYQRMQGWRKSEDWTKENGKFMPNVTTWLNGECWNNKVPDELHRSFRRMF